MLHCFYESEHLLLSVDFIYNSKAAVMFSERKQYSYRLSQFITNFLSLFGVALQLINVNI